MKREFKWGVPAAALALWIGGAASLPAHAQSAADDVPSTASDAADPAIESTNSAAAHASDTASSATDSSVVTDGSTTAAEASSSEATASPSTSTGSGDAETHGVATSNDASAPQPPATSSPNANASADLNASDQSGATSAGVNVNAGASSDTQLSHDMQNPAAQQSDHTNDARSDASATDSDASAQASANADAGGASSSQQNIAAGLDFGQATAQGLAINSVTPQSFFYHRGLRPGDVIVSYAGRPIRSQADFRRWVVYQPGQRIPVIVLRDGRNETIYVTYDEHRSNAIEHRAGYAPHSGGAYLGVTFDPFPQHQGAVVRSVAPDSPADHAGIRPGNIIVAVNGRDVSNHQDVIGIVASLQPGAAVDLAIAHRVVLGARPAQPQASYQSAAQSEASVVRQLPAVPVDQAASGRVDADTVVPQVGTQAGVTDSGVARPGDADRDGRVLDGDGRLNRREAARAISGRR